MRISEVSARSGVPASTLRYYEAEGLLPAARAENGYREYEPTALDRLAFIAQAKHLDLPLSSVRELVDAWESEPCHSVRARYRPMMSERAAQVDDRIAALAALRGTLTTAIRRLDALPDREEPCDAGCTFLDRPRAAPPALPVVPEAPVAPSPAPLACSLGSGDVEARLAEWHDALSGSERRDVPDGLRMTLPLTHLARITALAAAEQECCAFYAFRIDLHGPTFDLTITAPPDAREMLDRLVPTSEDPR
ncbi:transcriptional regulator, MerR family [Beutenbergia cavernae DSM 12333]|uniref:Transcriptional regulator, MerR family n=2 Tax=Beutenbergia TaxID=84756 RepID=C5BY35_BEUC1|nr:transcriptional regulator, MerR family [Beutenbergia cavernae DSM 12333]